MWQWRGCDFHSKCCQAQWIPCTEIFPQNRATHQWIAAGTCTAVAMSFGRSMTSMRDFISSVISRKVFFSKQVVCLKNIEILVYTGMSWVQECDGQPVQIWDMLYTARASQNGNLWFTFFVLSTRPWFCGNAIEATVKSWELGFYSHWLHSVSA